MGSNTLLLLQFYIIAYNYSPTKTVKLFTRLYRLTPTPLIVKRVKHCYEKHFQLLYEILTGQQS